MRVEAGVHHQVNSRRITVAAGVNGVGVSSATNVRAMVGMNRRAFHVRLSGAGLGATTGDIEGSIDGANWFTLVSAWTGNAIASIADGSLVTTPWLRLRITAENASPWNVHLVVTE